MIWRRPEQWTSIFHDWAEKNSMKNTVLTYWELREGDDTINAPFHLMEMDIMHQTFELMQKQKRAQILPAREPDKFDEYAVKFI
jgi:hypothetical protein